MSSKRRDSKMIQIDMVIADGRDGTRTKSIVTYLPVPSGFRASVMGLVDCSANEALE